jgi:hypothetical protein
MAETPHLPPPSQPGGPGPGAPDPGARQPLRLGLLAFVAAVLGSVLLGLLGGVLWSHLAPRAVLVVVSRGAADAVNPETNAFIAADGWFCVVAVIGGIISGLLGYLLAVRRYGALPMAGILVGGLAAAFAARWTGQRFGVMAFDSRLAVSKPGTLLREPIVLGSHGALAFWPLAAGLVAGGIEGVILLRERKRVQAQRNAYAGAHAYGSASAGSASAGSASAGSASAGSASAGSASAGSASAGPGPGARYDPGESSRPGERPQPGVSSWPGEAPQPGGWPEGPRQPGA